jgi:exodeoxyribonuclease X
MSPLVCLLDVETTGMEDQDQVVEIAAITGRLFERGAPIERTINTLVNPGIPIPCTASAVHHITDDMVRGAQTLDEVMESFPVCDLYVAHNAAFDRRFLPHLKAAPWACTMKVAYAEFEDAPSYGLQALRYWLGTAGPPTGSGGHAHRAMYDVWTLAGLFDDLRSRGWHKDRMIEVSSRPRLLRSMPFGKHKGAAFTSIPLDYLAWLRRQPDLDEDMEYTLKQLAEVR